MIDAISLKATEILRDDPVLAREIVRQYLRKQRTESTRRRVGLTVRQRDAFDFIEAYAEEHDGLTPSFDEIKEHMGFSSKSGVFRLVSALEERGYISRLANRARSIRLNEVA